MRAEHHVLLAEDEQADAFIFQFAVTKAKLDLSLHVATDGQEAVEYLSGKLSYADRAKYPLPALIVLDLKMPRMSGFDVLSWLAGQSDLTHIPALVLSSSSYEEDMRKARELGAREYYVKPSSTGALAKIIKTIADRWLNGSDKRVDSKVAAEPS